jgi:hypothetical protein
VKELCVSEAVPRLQNVPVQKVAYHPGLIVHPCTPNAPLEFLLTSTPPFSLLLSGQRRPAHISAMALPFGQSGSSAPEGLTPSEPPASQPPVATTAVKAKKYVSQACEACRSRRSRVGQVFTLTNVDGF